MRPVEYCITISLLRDVSLSPRLPLHSYKNTTRAGLLYS